MFKRLFKKPAPKEYEWEGLRLFEKGTGRFVAEVEQLKDRPTTEKWTNDLWRWSYAEPKWQFDLFRDEAAAKAFALGMVRGKK